MPKIPQREYVPPPIKKAAAAVPDGKPAVKKVSGLAQRLSALHKSPTESEPQDFDDLLQENPLDDLLADPLSVIPSNLNRPTLSEAELVKVVGTKYDALNALWNKAEGSLKKFLVPHHVEHCFESYVDDSEPNHQQYGIETCRSISWAKCGGSWRLCHEVYYTDHPEQVSVRPIVECSADIRLNLVKHFPKLREMVIEAAQKNIDSLDSAIAEFTDILK